MPETLRPSTVLPSKRTAHVVKTADGVQLVVEVAQPLNPSRGALLMCHPNPTGGGMMDSHAAHLLLPNAIHIQLQSQQSMGDIY